MRPKRKIHSTNRKFISLLKRSRDSEFVGQWKEMNVDLMMDDELIDVKSRLNDAKWRKVW